MKNVILFLFFSTLAHGKQPIAKHDLHILRHIGPIAPENVFPMAGPVYGGEVGQIRHAYGFDEITFNNGTIVGDGSGQTIAIVDAYAQPNIVSDLHTFDTNFGLPDPPTFTIVNQTGGSSLPTGDTGWGGEISADVEWAHAIAPAADILLVECNSAGFGDLFAGINYAKNFPGVVVVSMSFGAYEWSSETSYDSYFTTPAGHVGVSFVTASGDSGGGVTSSGQPLTYWPTCSPNVIAVGGTQISYDSSGNYLSEAAWSGSGGGICLYEKQPSYQNRIAVQSSSMRTFPDVAYNASTGSPFLIYDSYGYSGWVQVGGTSLSAPQWAAAMAIIAQGRSVSAQISLDGAKAVLPAIYQGTQNYASLFHDITSGNNGAYSCGVGYDLVTGIGSLQANNLVPYLVAFNASQCLPAVPSLSANPSQLYIAPGVTKSVTLTVTDNSLSGCSDLIGLNASAPSPLSASLSTASLSLTGGSSSSINLNISVPPGSANANGQVSISASDATKSTSQTISVIVDNTPPSTSVLSYSISTTKLGKKIKYTNQLSWTPSSDLSGIANYQIYKNGNLLATTSSTTYPDSNISAGQTNAYYVVAIGNEGLSSRSNTVTASP